MSQFRIKKIDQGLVDEWVFRLNDEGSQIGDDIDARDANGVAEALIDTQTLLLKTSTLAANVILDPSSGIAERLTLLESTAGQATLQDAYENGNMISVLSGRPLTLGAREEIKIDDAGNLSFRPVTMRVKGSGVSYVELSNSSIYSTLGDFLVGSMSPGQTLTVQSAGPFILRDTYLNNPITLSESGQTALGTTSQSLVGAINELKASAFNVSFQAVYDQSSPPKVLTNLGSGPINFENSNPASLGDTLRVTGNQTVTQKLKVFELEVGANTSLSDSFGFLTTSKIKTTSEVETPLINSGILDLILQDKRLSVPLSSGTITDLDTSSPSLVGAINELKAQIDSVGGALSFFGNEHNSANGQHSVITTQAGLGENTIKRMVVRDQTGLERFSVSGEGNVIAANLLLSGMDVVDLLGQLNTHMTDDGTSHSAVSAHLLASNPHNTVKSILGLDGDISLASPDGSIEIIPSGSSISIQSQESTTLQDAYDRLGTKEFTILTSEGLRFLDEVSSETMVMIRDIGILFNRDLNFEYISAKIDATSDLTINPEAELNLHSTNENVDIKSLDPSKTTIIQDIPFSEVAIPSIDPVIGNSVLGGLKTLTDIITGKQENTLWESLLPGQAVNFDPNGNSWMPISDIHPCNHFDSEMIWLESSELSPVLSRNLLATSVEGDFLQDGIFSVDIGTGLEPWRDGEELYIAKKGRSIIEIVDFSLLANETLLTIDPTGLNKSLTAITGAPTEASGEYYIESSSASSNINADRTMANLVSVINNEVFMLTPGFEFDMKGVLDGEAASAVLGIATILTVGDIVNLVPHTDANGASVQLIAVANGTSPAWLEFELGRTVEDTTRKLAEAINKTTYSGDEAQTIQGHMCIAKAEGTSIFLEWYKVGLTGRETTLSVSTPDITVFPFTGGSAVARLYRQDLRGSVISMTSENASAMTVTDISQDECESQFIMGKTIKLPSRKLKNEKRIKVGRILEVSGTFAKIKIG